MAGLQTDGTAPLAALSEVAAVDNRDSYSDTEKKGGGALHDNEHEPDGIHDGLIFPTEEERAVLRRVPDHVPWNAYLIAIVELAERFSFYGSSVVFTNFIQQPLPENSRTGAGGAHDTSGALGMGQRASTGLTTFYQFWCYVTPLLGAYIADTYWGRYKTVCVAVVIALIGHIILIVAGLPGVIDHQHGAVGAFIVALLVMGFGTGLFKANISPLVAEQYKRTKLFVRTESNGEKVIVDPALTISRVYMYFYLFINIGALIGQIGMTYSERYVGFWLAYTLPTVVFLLCPIVLYFGRNRYTHSPPTGSVLGTALRLWRYAARGRWSWNPVRCIRNLRAPDFWENVKPSAVMKREGEKPVWMTFDDQWVDEVKRGLSACAVFCWFPIYWLTYNQLNNNLTSQAATMVVGSVPNDVLSNLDPFALIIFIPLCDLVFYPALRRWGINFTQLKKITAGFITGSAAMIWACVVQAYIYKTNPCGKQASTCADANGDTIPSPLNVWIQTGSYVLIAFSEIFASITGLEYAFTKAPKNMRSLVMSVFLFMSAVSSALGEAFVSLSADPLLVWNYGVMAVLAGITAVALWFSVRNLDAKEDELNNLSEGHVDAKH
ncbi:PTR2-domain-containing protein [Mycena amicta]|nr:PTR2-domain-containing protein [Mycena amicta]